jgi:hypothetical protein
VRPHQSFHLYATVRIGHLKNNSRTFTKRPNLLWFLNLVFLLYIFFFNFNFYYSCIINFTITILLFLFLPSSISLFFLCYNWLFSLPITVSAPSPPLFSIFTSLSYPSPTCHHTTSPSYTLITHWLDYCTNCKQPQHPPIPDISTHHYNNRNTHKHTQGPQKPTAPIHVPLPNPHLPQPLFSATSTNSPKSITCLITIICLQLPIFIDFTIKGFSI